MLLETITFYQFLSLSPLFDSGQTLKLVPTVCYFITICLILIFVLLYALAGVPAILRPGVGAGCSSMYNI